MKERGCNEIKICGFSESDIGLIQAHTVNRVSDIDVDSQRRHVNDKRAARTFR